jgi:hypothetical protein
MGRAGDAIRAYHQLFKEHKARPRAGSPHSLACLQKPTAEKLRQGWVRSLLISSAVPRRPAQRPSKNKPVLGALLVSVRCPREPRLACNSRGCVFCK